MSSLSISKVEHKVKFFLVIKYLDTKILIQFILF